MVPEFGLTPVYPPAVKQDAHECNLEQLALEIPGREAFGCIR
jgi:hypothetical protein